MVAPPAINSQLLEAVLRAVPGAVVATDPAGVITLINPAAESLFAITSAQAIGHPLQALHPTLGHRLARAQEEKLTSPLVFELELGDQHYYFASLAPMPNGSGLTGWVAVLQDVTPLKKLEQWKTEAIETAAHDLRDPLNLIAGATNFLRDSLPEPTREQDESLSMIKAATDRMAALIEQLLNLEHVESGAEITMARLTLRRVIEQVVRDFKLAADQKGVSLEFEGDPATGRVLGDESWLQRAAANLVSNAIKYTPGSGRVRVCYRESDGQGIVEVTDTGPGIPLEAQGRLFERFYRVRGAATRLNPGSGLGLAIVKTIVERHAGRVWVSSVEGQGSTFGFAVPLLK